MPDGKGDGFGGPVAHHVFDILENFPAQVEEKRKHRGHQGDLEPENSHATVNERQSRKQTDGQVTPQNRAFEAGAVEIEQNRSAGRNQQSGTIDECTERHSGHKKHTRECSCKAARKAAAGQRAERLVDPVDLDVEVIIDGIGCSGNQPTRKACEQDVLPGGKRTGHQRTDGDAQHPDEHVDRARKLPGCQ